MKSNPNTSFYKFMMLPIFMIGFIIGCIVGGGIVAYSKAAQVANTAAEMGEDYKAVKKEVGDDVKAGYETTKGKLGETAANIDGEKLGKEITEQTQQTIQEAGETTRKALGHMREKFKSKNEQKEEQR